MLPPLSPVSMLATPSIVMLFEFGRWPLTVKALTEPFSTPARSFGTTPGTRFAKLNRARPLLAMFVRASFSSVNERSPLSTCSSLTRLSTVTFSSIPPTLERDVPGRGPVVRVDDHVRPLRGLEARQGGLEHVAVGADDREGEPAILVRRRRVHIALRAAGEGDGRAGKHSPRGVAHRSGDGCAGGLGTERHRAREHDHSHESHSCDGREAVNEGHRSS